MATFLGYPYIDKYPSKISPAPCVWSNLNATFRNCLPNEDTNSTLKIVRPGIQRLSIRRMYELSIDLFSRCTNLKTLDLNGVSFKSEIRAVAPFCDGIQSAFPPIRARNLKIFSGVEEIVPSISTIAMMRSGFNFGSSTLKSLNFTMASGFSEIDHLLRSSTLDTLVIRWLPFFRKKF